MVDKILSGLAQIDALRAQLVAVEDDFGLWLIELQICVSKDEEAAGHCLLHQLLGEVDKLLRLRRRRDHEIDREISAAR